MTDKPATEAQFRLLLESMGDTLTPEQHKIGQVINILTEETIRFRDKLKEDTGEILTVGDTRIALDALIELMAGRPSADKLSPEQKALTQIWIDRLTLFSRK